MNFHIQLKNSRNKLNLSQEFVARQLGVSQSNYSKYERGTQEVPPDLVGKLINIVKEPRLKREYIVSRNLGLLNVPMLDNIDENYTTILDCLIEEMQEAIASAEILKKLTRNKRSCEYFSKSEQEEFFKHQLQILDAYMALDVNSLVVVELFDFDIALAEKELHRKYKAKRYYLER